MNKEVTVAVIGAGAAGLNALRNLNERSENSLTTFKTTAFEQSTRIGGTWCYTQCVGTDQFGLPVHSSMYKYLRTNLPKECMGYPDHPFPSHLPSFITHHDVLAYLEDYAAHFDIRKYIKFKTIVEHIKPVFDDSKPFGVKWDVTTSDVTNRMDKQTDKQTQTFDAVLVCNGHYAKPYIQKLPGIETFKGHVMHSHDYREPSPYAGKTVAVLGAKPSGMDVSSEVSEEAKKVYLCHNKPKLTTTLPSKVEQKPGIKCCQERTVEFLDGSTSEVDAIILCTGYLYDFPFFDESIPIKVEDERVFPLYKHFLSVDYPSLGIIGIPKYVIPLPIFHFQVKYFKSIMDGSGTLPSKKEMMKEEEEELNALITRGCPTRYAHIFEGREFKYLTELAALGNFDDVSPVFEKIFLTTTKHRLTDFTTFRNFNFVMTNDDTDFKVVDDYTTF